MTIYYERIPSTDPRLGRHIRHDDRSRAYAFRAYGDPLVSVRHERHIPILDQGHLGSCTGNAGIGALGSGVYFSQHGTHYSLDEVGAVQLYSDATALDGYPGTYPPDDTGSDGLSIATALKANGEISAYLHAFSLSDALAALAERPVIVGIAWHQDMFNPAPDGQVRPTGDIAGGHEIVADELDVENSRIWFANSWGTSWGVAGRFWMTWEDFGTLLADQGDVTVFVPVPVPTPVPPTPPAPPVDPVDQTLADAVRDWAWARHVGANAKAAKAVRAWMAAKGL
jgi:hypothetical protein